MLTITLILLLVTQVTSLMWCVSDPTGNVITWYKWGVLQPNYGEPGLHCYNAVSSTYQINDINNQKDSSGPHNCVSSDKQQVTFPSVQVWNQLPKEHVIKVLKTFEVCFQLDKSLLNRNILSHMNFLTHNVI